MESGDHTLWRKGGWGMEGGDNALWRNRHVESKGGWRYTSYMIDISLT